MDDFPDWLRTKGHKLWNSARQFISDNKTVLKPLVKNFVVGAASAIDPVLGSVASTALQAYGGKIKAEDPYAISKKYVDALYGMGPLHPAPRFCTQYMCQVFKRV